jgi:hypothetical protein
MKFTRALVGAAVVVSTLSLAAAPSQSAVITSATPASTPILNRPQFHGSSAVVEAIEQVGSRVVVAGHGITSLSQGNGTTVTNSKAGLTATASGDPSRVATFMGPAGGNWWSLLPDADGTHVYAGSSSGVSKFDVGTGAQTWTHSLGGKVASIDSVPGTSFIIVSGSFAGGIAVLRKDTGATASYTVPKLNSGGSILHSDVQPGGNHWVGVGSFKSLGGQTRSQIAMLTLGATSASVTAWDAPMSHPNGVTPCRSDFANPFHDVAFLRNGSAFFVVSTGASNVGMCDAVSRFNMSNISTTAKPAWITGTCTDTFWSVGSAPDSSYIMVGGHFKCIGQHHSTTGGSISGTNLSRFALAALDPTTGNVLPWKGDKCRAVGTREISWVNGGVAIGYDCTFFGNHESVNPEPSPQIARDRFAVLALP